MHELSIVQNIVEIAEDAVIDAGANRVEAVYVRVGALSGVVRDALEFAYDVATKGTLLEGSRLVVEELPIVLYCADCGAERVLDDVRVIRCPACGAATVNIVQGRELEIDSIEVTDDAAEILAD
jgi:hydrogenase nickel incorporation protein HypA/HybF